MEERGEKGSDDKTEEATDERRKQYREQGNIANPREVAAAVALGLFAIMLPFLGQSIYTGIRLSMHRSWTIVGETRLRNAPMGQAIYTVTEPLLPWLAGGAFILTVTPVLVALLFTRFNWSWKKLEWNFSKINPLPGIMRMFSPTMLMEMGKTILKFTVLTTCLVILLKQEMGQVEVMMMSDLPVSMSALSSSVGHLLSVMAVAVGIVGLSEYAFAWWKIEREMKMTKQEIKDENKAQEGDPHVKGQRRRMARDIAMRRSLAHVPKATFVVTNPTHFSVAIRFVAGMPAPIVVAKGQDFLALRIREIAKENDISLVENKALARALYKTVKVGEEIPPSLYSSVIEVIKYIYSTRGQSYFDKFAINIRPHQPRA